MNKIFMLFLIVFLANIANSKTNNIMNLEVGNSLEKMSYIEVLANQSAKFKPYCWYDQSSLGGCFRASSVMLIGYDENKNTLAYLQQEQGQVEDSGITYRLKVQNLGTNKILINQKF